MELIRGERAERPEEPEDSAKEIIRYSRSEVARKVRGVRKKYLAIAALVLAVAALIGGVLLWRSGRLFILDEVVSPDGTCRTTVYSKRLNGSSFSFEDEISVITEQEDGGFSDVPDSETLYPADSVIISISQGPQNRIVTTTEGLKANSRGLLVADETGHTTRPGIFASGDVVNGARTVVEAVAHSKVVAESMHEYMQSLPKEDD